MGLGDAGRPPVQPVLPNKGMETGRRQAPCSSGSRLLSSESVQLGRPGGRGPPADRAQGRARAVGHLADAEPTCSGLRRAAWLGGGCCFSTLSRQLKGRDDLAVGPRVSVSTSL